MAETETKESEVKLEDQEARDTSVDATAEASGEEEAPVEDVKAGPQPPLGTGIFIPPFKNLCDHHHG